MKKFIISTIALGLALTIMVLFANNAYALPNPQAQPQPQVQARPSQDVRALRPALIDSLRNAYRAEPRLGAFITWVDSLGRANGNISEDRARELVDQRAAMFRETRRYQIETRGWPVIGAQNAPVTMVVYFSITCPVCKSNFVELHNAITSGPLAGRVRMIAKPFSTHVGDRALIAAHDMGRFTDFKLALAQNRGRIDENAIYNTAANLYFDRQRFRAMVEDPGTWARAEQSVAEANSFGITHVPTYFVNGRLYNSLVSVRWVIDFLEYELEQSR